VGQRNGNKKRSRLIINRNPGSSLREGEKARIIRDQNVTVGEYTKISRTNTSQKKGNNAVDEVVF